MNYFFKEVIPQMLSVFDNNKDIARYLILDVLKDNPNYQENIKEVLDKSVDDDKEEKDKNIQSK
ncbi:MAG: hypothetical protein Q4G04_02930 [bacterium]|nr:hypothetical protein [bacterium]